MVWLVSLDIIDLKTKNETLGTSDNSPMTTTSPIKKLNEGPHDSLYPTNPSFQVPIPIPNLEKIIFVQVEAQLKNLLVDMENLKYMVSQFDLKFTTREDFIVEVMHVVDTTL